MRYDCTAGPLSAWLDSLIGVCCAMHDKALDHSYDIATFAAGNWEFVTCVWGLHPWLAPIVGLAVAGPVGWHYYQNSEKQKEQGR
jgi:divalent metal cation (Fe/Co/Zn/Cd) transporter